MSGEIPEPDALDGVPHPRLTPTLFGQEAAEAAFLDAVATGRPPHGWMIAGPKGVGKATLAWRMARHLLAGAAGDTLAMDADHPVFRQVAALSAPRLFLCRRPWDEKAKRLRTAITVDETRALKGFFQMSAAEGGWRVAIVDAADEMNTAAANALLKILEEPPERAALILVAHQPASLLPTLRSRCRVLRCGPVPAAALAAALDQAGVMADPEEVAALGALADGSVGAAALLVAGEGLAIYDDLLALAAAAPGMDRRRVISLAESCAGRDAEARYGLVLDLLRLMLSRLALAGAGAPGTAVSDVEAGLWARFGGAVAARHWAGHASEMVARTRHARAVHLDPAQVILDTCLRIDTAAAEARAFAA